MPSLFEKRCWFGLLAMLICFPSLAAEADEVADQIVELRNAIGSSVSGDAEAFKEAVKQAAEKAADEEAKPKVCCKGCDLCPGDCSKCPVEGCASCTTANSDEPLSCCTGKLPSRVNANNIYQSNAVPVPQVRNLYQGTRIQPPAPSAGYNSSPPLYESAFSLEKIAHRLEMQNLLDEADVVRKAAIELRRSAREKAGK